MALAQDFSHFVTLLDQLEGITSTNDKKDIIALHIDKPYVDTLFNLALSPYITFGVKNFELPTRWEANPDLSVNRFLALAGELRARRLTGSAARAEITEVLASYGIHVGEKLARVLRQDLKVSCGISLINKAAGKAVVDDFDVQLADKMSDKFDWNGGPYFVEYKYDGMRLVAEWDPSVPTDIVYRSRDGRIQENVPEHITAELLISVERLINGNLAHEWKDGIYFDGEAMLQNDEGTESYHGTMSIMKSSKAKNRDQLRYRLFDVVPAAAWRKMKYDRKFIERRKDVVEACHGKFIVPSQGKLCHSEQEIRAAYEELLELGAEGAIIKKPDSKYSWKRNRDWTKFKPVYTADLEITGVYEGDELNGFAGTLGGFHLKGYLEDGTYVECDCGSGFTLKPNAKTGNPTRDEIWKNPKKFIGLTAEVEYQEVTMAQSKDIASLRFVIFKGIRTDK